MANKKTIPQKKKQRISLEESAASVQRTIDSLRDYKPYEGRGVQEGTKRGPYRPREKGVIKDKKFITEVCQECRQEFTYKRKGKRLRKFCSNKCKQKHYRRAKLRRKWQKQADLEVI